jgi:putative FmdB family regulatory protein
MPIYEYRCENGHNFEVIQSMSDDPVASCEECGASVQRVFHPVAVHFKGSGFYTTDYAKSKTAKAGDSGSGESGTSEGGSSSSKKEKDSKPSPSKSESKKDSTTSAAS